jgi:hypothetical protein
MRLQALAMELNGPPIGPGGLQILQSILLDTVTPRLASG